MLISTLLLVLGLALVLAGAEALVEGASGIARKLGIGEFAIGLTVVGMGTSAPEFVVSLFGAIEGNADVAIGNVIGSNIFNTLLILGLTAVILPIAVTPSNRKRDLPLNLGVTLLFLLLGLKSTLFHRGTDSLGRIEGILFLVLFIGYIILSLVQGKETAPAQDGGKKPRLGLAILLSLGGIAALAFGGRLFVDNSVELAHGLGVSDKFIAITLLAGGTSLPELVTCIVAAAKKKGQLALGNIIGSNIFNILLIIGTAAVIQPLSFASINLIDAAALAVSAILPLVIVLIFKRRKVIGRADGVLFTLIWLAYMVWLGLNL